MVTPEAENKGLKDGEVSGGVWGKLFVIEKSGVISNQGSKFSLVSWR